MPDPLGPTQVGEVLASSTAAGRSAPEAPSGTPQVKGAESDTDEMRALRDWCGIVMYGVKPGPLGVDWRPLYRKSTESSASTSATGPSAPAAPIDTSQGEH